MTTEQLRRTRNKDPFIAFTIQMAGGTTYRVPHRDYLSIHPAGRIATVYLPDGTASTLDIKLITELVEDRVESATPETGV